MGAEQYKEALVHINNALASENIDKYRSAFEEQKAKILYGSAKGVHPITGFERECTLVKYGKKFHPVKKYAIDLADMTPSNRDKWLPSNRKWYLKIEGLYRDFIEKEAVKKDFQLSQEYCMILTIRDPERKAPVYDEVTQQLTTRNFVHHDVRVRSVVHVTNE